MWALNSLHPEVEGKVSITGPLGSPSLMYLWPLSVSTCSHITIATIHFLFLCYRRYTESAQTDFSNNNFSPILNKDWSVYLSMSEGNLFLNVVLPEIKHSPHAYPSMQHFPVSPSSSPDLQSVGLSWVSPSPERFANSPSKDAHIWSSFPYLLPWFSPHHCVFNTNPSSTPHSSPLYITSHSMLSFLVMSLLPFIWNRNTQDIQI